VPTRTRNVSSVALRLPQRSAAWLFDCGEGTQQQLLQTDVGVSRISRIFITHMHGDHLFGLVGLLATSAMAGKGQPVDLYGPDRLGDYVDACQQYSRTGLSEGVSVHAVSPGVVYEDEAFIVTCNLLRHRIPAFGYRVSEKDRPGTFLVDKAKALGIPSGPLFGRLKRGETVPLADGREIKGADLCGPPEAGRKMAYITDTIYCENAVELARDADLLIHEATFATADLDLARQSLHSTASMAARVAAEAGAKQLIITHISPRYTSGQGITAAELLAEARSVFPQTELAHDFMRIEVARR
jgi:ribonuclease Z